MPLLVLAAVFTAVMLLLFRTRPVPAEEVPAEDAISAFRRRLAENQDWIAPLAETATLLSDLMAHPQLGGPGFLLIQFPQEPGGACRPALSAQYPNINEALYRRVVRRELEGEALVQAGLPSGLLEYNPAFETESGGVVRVTVQLAFLPPDLADPLKGRRRAEALAVLAEALAPRLPALSIRTLGADLLLTLRD